MAAWLVGTQMADRILTTQVELCELLGLMSASELRHALFELKRKGAILAYRSVRRTVFVSYRSSIANAQTISQELAKYGSFE